ncbi:MAG: S8 family peptidase [Actinobacteria bacterium]|nr:S8 family peptidase [Actinomycetota bacterium]
MASSNDRQPYIITFKRKDERSRAEDKQDIVRETISSDVQFFTSEDFARDKNPVPSAQDMESLGYDVNRYGAPLLMARLTPDEAQALDADDNVLRVEEDGEMHALDLHLEGTPAPQAETIPAGVNQVKAPDAWPTSQGEGIKVFICDTGIDSNHPDLVNNLRAGKSFVTSESSTEDYHGHGTHCAGTVAASLNGSGVVGVAPYAYLYPIKVLSSTGSGNWSWLIAALDWIADKKGARIASMSLGGSGAPQALGDMCQTVYDDGVLLVAAAGNSGGPPDTVGYPAKFDSVVAVSAVDSTDTIAGFSSVGPAVEVCAPGVNVLSTTKGGGVGYMSGTSMACPHVSGVAALAWGSHRGGNNKQIRWLLNTFAVNVGDGDPEKYGDGRVDANTTSFYIGNPPEF